ncbi:MAG TPA: nuclear transport factor 2 family protein [Puia sp.]|nr:nuclear transport factor 2 family protein [Puia sp.]
MVTHHKSSLEKDKEILISIVKEMTESSTGAQSTKHWADDALWFDIPPFASKGITPAVKMFDSVFKNFKSCKITLLETEVILSDDMGIVCTIQKVEIVFQNDSSKTLFVRETDCFKKLNDRWMLVHQHASVPAGGEWDGKIIVG